MRLLVTDKDILMYEIKAEDAHEDFSKDKEIFDFSNYSTESKCCDDSNKLVVGKRKDETGGVTIKEFAGLKPKMYSFLVDNRGCSLLFSFCSWLVNFYSLLVFFLTGLAPVQYSNRNIQNIQNIQNV